ncbi:MAG: hypothetical protein WCC94_11815 [Candidatus Bathyarchaeia archaeon]
MARGFGFVLTIGITLRLGMLNCADADEWFLRRLRVRRLCIGNGMAA